MAVRSGGEEFNYRYLHETRNMTSGYTSNGTYIGNGNFNTSSWNPTSVFVQGQGYGSYDDYSAGMQIAGEVSNSLLGILQMWAADRFSNGGGGGSSKKAKASAEAETLSGQIEAKKNEIKGYQDEKTEKAKVAKPGEAELNNAKGAYEAAKAATAAAEADMNAAKTASESASPEQKEALEKTYNDTKSAYAKAQEAEKEAEAKQTEEQNKYDDALKAYNDAQAKIKELDGKIATAEKELKELQDKKLQEDDDIYLDKADGNWASRMIGKKHSQKKLIHKFDKAKDAYLKDKSEENKKALKDAADALLEDNPTYAVRDVVSHYYKNGEVIV